MIHRRKPPGDLWTFMYGRKLQRASENCSYTRPLYSKEFIWAVSFRAGLHQRSWKLKPGNLLQILRNPVSLHRSCLKVGKSGKTCFDRDLSIAVFTLFDRKSVAFVILILYCGDCWLLHIDHAGKARVNVISLHTAVLSDSYLMLECNRSNLS
jgi:hypothetical protein